MAVTNGWGQGVINNTNGWGKLATNNIGAGSVYENSASGDTALIGTSAAFSYSASSFTQADADPTPTITGTTGGTFSGTTGLVFVSTSTGQIDLSASTIAAHVVTYTVDGVSSNFNLSVTAAPFASTQSFNFDGVDDRIDVGSILPTQNTFSVSCWVKVSDTSTAQTIIDNRDSDSDGWSIFIFNNKIFFRLNSYFGTQKSISGQSDNWLNVVATYDGSTTNLYINNDGSPVSQSTTQSIDVSSSLTFGTRSYTTGATLNGNLDEVSLYTTVLSSTDVASIYGTGVPNDISSLNPVAWYRMGENSNYKSPQWLMPENSNKDKVSNYSYQFDGVNDFVTVNDDASLKVVTANHSLTFWMKTTDGSTQVLSEKGSSDELAAWVVSNKIRWAGPNTFNSSIDVNDGNWKHIAFVADGSSSFIYINGSLDATGSTKIQASANSSNYVFGARSGGSFAFDGQLDQIAIFNRALSSTEVSALYNSGTVTTLPSGAVAHYKLGEEATFSTNWTIPDQVGSNDGTSSNMTIEDRVGDSPNSTNNAVSFNMVEADRETDVPS